VPGEVKLILQKGGETTEWKKGRSGRRLTFLTGETNFQTICLKEKEEARGLRDGEQNGKTRKVKRPYGRTKKKLFRINGWES